ncbi:MAG: indolepyruvate oxidoreductase subunit beta [Desulfurococcales archaeon]|nr:indolepyruvate oxidoreductase subunit beta [Desulfurococcales archaeon]
MVLNIVIVGVGGQGLLSMAQLIGWASVESGTNVLVAETHGLSQRGGSVIVHVRLGDASSPLIPVGRGNIMLALELLEAARYVNYMRNDGVAVVNKKLIKPNIPGVRVEREENVINTLKGTVKNTYFIDASTKALEEGNPVGANMVILGFLGNMLERAGVLQEGLLGKYAGSIGRGSLAEINSKLYEWGYSLASQQVSNELINSIKSWLLKEVP